MRLERGNGLGADVYAGLRTHPGRTGLSVAAIGLGLFALSLLLAMLAGLRERANRLVADFGADVVALVASGTRSEGLTDAHLRRLRANLPGAAVSGVRRLALPLAGGGGALRVAAVDSEWFRVRPSAFAAGRGLDGYDDLGGERHAVAGAGLAARFGVRPGDILQLRGLPLTIVGVLARSGTPVDRAVLVGLEGIEAIHVDWHGGAPIPGLTIGPEHVRKFDLSPKSVTAALVGLDSRIAVFRVQRQINTMDEEPLTAILPGATLQELWSLVGVAERALLAVSALVVVVGLAGLVAVVVASLGERRRELAILRALGASPPQVFVLLALESVLMSLAGIVLGLGLLYGAGALAAPGLAAGWGLELGLGWPSAGEWRLLVAVMAASLLASLVPAWRAYRYSLADGLTIRI